MTLPYFLRVPEDYKRVVGRRMGGGRKMSKTNGFIYVVPELDTGR